jgi:glycosyltransferase involved in cell wall biosynthesis
VFALRRAIREATPDVVISFLTKVNVMTLLATRGLNIPVVVSERNNPLRQPMDPVWLRLRDRLYPRAARLVAQTEGVVAQLPPAIRAKATVIPNPIVPQPAVPQAPDVKVVGAVGRLVEQKGFDLFLRAVSRIASQVPDWTFVIWGEGEDREKLVRLAGDLGLAGRVRFPGVSQRPQDWLAQTAIFVLSSRYEGFPNALGEAMVSGIPSVAFDCPFGPRSLITDGVDGLLVEPENVDALAIAIARLVGDASLRSQLAEHARSSVRRFAPERVLKQWDELARQAAATRSESV